MVRPIGSKFSGASLAAVVAGAAAAQAQTPSSTFPGGASSLRETYQDWHVARAPRESVAHISTFSQQQAQENGQRILSIELVASSDGETARGNLILPFALLLNAGIKLQVDEGEIGEPVRFRTCLTARCVVPFSVNEKSVAALRGGRSLHHHGIASRSNQPLVFTVSLKGFSAAVARAAQLAVTD